METLLRYLHPYPSHTTPPAQPPPVPNTPRTHRRIRLVLPGFAFADDGGEDFGGLRFIKKALDVRVSFDTFLPQSLMTRWREPVPNERPPPSVANPNAESAAAGDAAGTADFD